MLTSGKINGGIRSLFDHHVNVVAAARHFVGQVWSLSYCTSGLCRAGHVAMYFFCDNVNVRVK